MNESETPLRSQIEISTTNENGIFTLNGTLNGEKLYLGVSVVNRVDNITDLTERLNGKYPVVDRVYGDQRLLISHSPIFRLFDIPEPSQSVHLGSETRYAGRTENKETAMQLLGELKMSMPPHGHDGTETYEHITGELEVRMQNLETREIVKNVLSELNRRVVVPEGYIHQVKSLNGLAISVLVCDFTRHDYYPELNLFEEN